MPVQFKKFDVRPLLAKGNEPFALIRSRVDALRQGEGLTVVAPFLPSPLIEKLNSEGFHSSAQHLPEGGWSVNFWREA
jgi:uncharacterized protein (DUF2249 family)